MKSFVRACGVAAAALGCLAAATSAAPSIASETDGGPGIHYLDHAIAGEDGSKLFTDENKQIAAIGSDLAEAAFAALPRPRSLPELVEANLDAEVQGVEQECLANAVYFEARGESIEGQMAVAEVVLNRAASGKYPAGICAVVTQRKQFSFIVDGKFPEANKGSKAWRKAVAISHIALRDAGGRIPSDVLWYHADYVAPVWGKSLNREAKIGLHIFYS